MSLAYIVSLFYQRNVKMSYYDEAHTFLYSCVSLTRIYSAAGGAAGGEEAAEEEEEEEEEEQEAPAVDMFGGDDGGDY